jgi:tetratricopeptide (TPR) repeat protein
MDQSIIDEYFEGIFQEELESADAIGKELAGEETPFDNKYRAREILKKVLSHEILAEYPDAEETISLKGVLYYLLGINAFETEENGAAREHFRNAIDQFEKLSFSCAKNFLNYLQEIFNSNGLLLVNADSDTDGVGFVSKAMKIYEKIIAYIKTTKVTVYNTMAEYNLKLLTFNSTSLPKLYKKVPQIQPKFQFYYLGGLNLEKAEELYTLTNFYFAQCYTKYGQKDEAAYYCGQTLKRQLDLQEYDGLEWCNSSMGLAEYYKGNHNYSQAMYIVFVALSILPDGKKKKTRASLNIMMGNIMADFLDYNIGLIKCGLPEKEDGEIKLLLNQINRELLVFEDLKVTFPNNNVFLNFGLPKNRSTKIWTGLSRSSEWRSRNTKRLCPCTYLTALSRSTSKSISKSLTCTRNWGT